MRKVIEFHVNVIIADKKVDAILRICIHLLNHGFFEDILGPLLVTTDHSGDLVS